MAVLAGCGSGSGSVAVPSQDVATVLKLPDLKGQTIVVNTYGGNFADATKKYIVEPFEAATGAKVVLNTTCCDTFETQVKNQQFAGDVVYGDDYGPMQAWGDQGLFRSDPRLAQIAKARGGDPDYIQDNLIETTAYAIVLAWNTKVGNDHPTSWTDFFDTSKYRGTRGLPNYPEAVLETAELGSGTSASSVYPLDTGKAFAALTALRKNASVNFWKTGAELQDKLGTGEIAYTPAYSSRVAAGIKQGLPIDMTFNQGLLLPSGVAIPATAKNIDGAVAFIDFALQPKVQAAAANATGSSPAYPEAASMLDPDMQKYSATSPENLSKLVKLDNKFWSKNINPLMQVYTKWMNGS